eukprot:TRINITY_DN2962_c0_g1_i1.p1 TRINITY_DN2962_c0_g1~~TRINITY_DN2962_c0_g1_i1.p1  ORF type:complete len:686 (+),score=77.41 TRINITY_DN2962_c0_g1_i1:33-2090(+)
MSVPSLNLGTVRQDGRDTQEDITGAVTINDVASPRPKTAKGMENDPGENNCFLNVVIQALLHIKVLCDKFIETGKKAHGHKCSTQTCVYCNVYDLIKSVHSENDSINARVLRKTLANGVQSFRLNEMNDAAEVFEEMVRRLADCVTGERNWIHDIFSMTVVTEKVCTACLSKSRMGDPYEKLMHSLPASVLYRAAPGDVNPFRMFKLFGALPPDRVSCEPPCKGSCEISERCTKLPAVVTINFVWNTHSAPAEHISGVCKQLGERVQLTDLDIFKNTKPALATLLGLICYYKGSHYVGYFKNEEQDLWIYFDDARVRVLGGSWNEVVNHITSSMAQPCLLFYKPVVVKDFVASTHNEDRRLEEEILQRVIRSTSPRPLTRHPQPVHTKHDAASYQERPNGFDGRAKYSARETERDPKRDTVRNVRDTGRDIRDTRDTVRDIGRDTVRDIERDTERRDTGRDMGRDYARDMGRDIGRDMGRDMRDTNRVGDRHKPELGKYKGEEERQPWDPRRSELTRVTHERPVTAEERYGGMPRSGDYGKQLQPTTASTYNPTTYSNRCASPEGYRRHTVPSRGPHVSDMHTRLPYHTTSMDYGKATVSDMHTRLPYTTSMDYGKATPRGSSPFHTQTERRTGASTPRSGLTGAPGYSQTFNRIAHTVPSYTAPRSVLTPRATQQTYLYPSSLR